MSITDLGVPTNGSPAPGHPLSGVGHVPALSPGETLSKRDFTSDQEVRWCPGCGDYAILAAVQGFLPELGIKRENMVFVSGIGCSSRFPYYLDTYGMHSIHGRAPAIATGIAAARDDLSVWVVTGDGDALSIGGNHLIHALRRNINLKILLFNNEIYGLTKGQYSPTSRTGQVTKSSPLGSLDTPFNPVSLALGAEATFVARTLDSDRQHLTSVLRAAAEHRGSAFVEIYQNCPIFNDGAFDVLKDRTEAQARIFYLNNGEEVVAGDGDDQRVVVRDDQGVMTVVRRADADPARIVVHDVSAENPAAAFALSRLDSAELTSVPMGVFRNVARPAYDDLLRDQIDSARTGEITDADIDALLAGKDTWTVSGPA
ncbi:2-oxoacid:ferredoxin oxidoreductase subunit beta [Intrasporangium sp. DVR]|uniref:2-oxoacid:ferredoxin oxidoreductase subunit beta n=1 Tax=Intrasporangium sp. DVR TaxID=3127867 RepID=UPI00313A5C0F